MADANIFPSPRPCTWPDGGCGAPIRDFETERGRRQVVDATPARGIVVGSLITTLEPNDGMVVGRQHPDARIVARVTQVWTDHHATCSAWAAKLERERAAKAGRP